MNKLALVLVVLLAGLSLGCDSSCEQVCERSKECSEPQTIDNSFLGDASCGDLCDLSEEFAELVNCDGEWSDYVACTADALPPSGCAVANDVCKAEAEAYSQCFGFDDDNNN